MSNVLTGVCKNCLKEQPELNLFCVNCKIRDWMGDKEKTIQSYMSENTLNSQEIKSNISHTRSGQKHTTDGRIQVPKKAWIVRIATISFLAGIISFNIIEAIRINDPLVLYLSIVLIDAFLIVLVGWVFFKNPAKGKAGNDLVSILVPVYNQKDMIPIVIDAIANSTYKNIEIIAVNDGSKDGSKEILDNLAKKYPMLKVFHKKNGGKRSANYLGFTKSKGKFLVLIDSDSIVDQYAIMELMKAFNGNPNAGAMVGHIKAWNSKKRLLAKLQDAWYDYEYNILKATQSTVNHVIVCSGCFAGYRREAIEKFVPLWNMSETSDKDLDPKKYFKNNPWKYNFFSKFSLKLLRWAARFDDAEDSVSTVQTLVDWETKYVSSSIAYTEVPDTIKGFTKQQIRWRKGTLRATFFLSTFLWKRNPIASFMTYINMIALLTTPLILIIAFVYAPFVLNKYWFPIALMVGIAGIGFAHGLDYKLRDPSAKNWKYRPLFSIIGNFLFPFLLVPALLTFRKSQWLTR